MAQFSFVARESSGAMARGVITALSVAEAARQLRQEGKFPVKVEPAGRGATAAPSEAASPAAVGPARGGKFKHDDVIAFSNQLMVLVDTGVSLAEALEACRNPKNSPVFSRTLDAVIDQVQGGAPFSAALAAHPRVFSPLFVNMVRASEASGMLATMLARVSDYMVGQRDLKKKIRGAVTYPAAMLAFAICVTVFLLTWVLPRFSAIYAGREKALPAATRILLQFSDQLRHHGLYLAGGAALVVVGLVFHIRRPSGRRHLDWLKLNLPILGPMFHKSIVARCLRTLGTMIQAGVAMLEAVELTRAACGNLYFEALWTEAIEDMQHGKQLSESLARSNLVPGTIVQMVRAGEQSGRLGQVLERVADHCEADLSVAVKTATSMLEPLIIGFLGIVVGGLVIALLLPIFTISRAMRP